MTIGNRNPKNPPRVATSKGTRISKKNRCRLRKSSSSITCWRNFSFTKAMNEDIGALLRDRLRPEWLRPGGRTPPAGRVKGRRDGAHRILFARGPVPVRVEGRLEGRGQIGPPRGWGDHRGRWPGRRRHHRPPERRDARLE